MPNSSGVKIRTSNICMGVVTQSACGTRGAMLKLHVQSSDLIGTHSSDRHSKSKDLI